MTTFNADDAPVRMLVDSLRPLHAGSFLSRLKEVQGRGIMKLTGDLSIEDALGEVRDGPG